MKLDAVIFDMDGTITDTEKFYNRTWPLAFAACGYPDFTREDALMQRSLNHADAQKLWGSRYGEDFSFETVHQYNTKLVLDLMEKEGIETKPGLDQLLTYLKDHKIRAAVATATKLDRALERLKTVGLENAFDTVISASMVTRMSICMSARNWARIRRIVLLWRIRLTGSVRHMMPDVLPS